MLKHLWYVAGRSADVGAQPVPVRLLGQDLVLFRGSDGCVQCPYHGWRHAPDARPQGPVP